MKVRTPVKPVVAVSQPNLLNSTNAMEYQWYKDGNAINRATNQFYLMTESGVYSVKTTDGNRCNAFSDNVVNAFTGLYDEEFAEQINTYPNPVTGELILEVVNDLLMKGVDYYVLNELGQQVIPTQKASIFNKDQSYREAIRNVFAPFVH